MFDLLPDRFTDRCVSGITLLAIRFDYSRSFYAQGYENWSEIPRSAARRGLELFIFREIAASPGKLCSLIVRLISVFFVRSGRVGAHDLICASGLNILYSVGE